MSAIDPNFMWKRATHYRLEPLEWLRCRLEGDIQTANQKVGEFRQALANSNFNQEGVNERQKALSDELLFARHNQLKQRLEQVEINIKRIRGLPHWQRYVIVMSGDTVEYTPQPSGLAEVLFSLMDRHATKETMVADVAMTIAPQHGHLRHNKEDWFSLAQWRADLNDLSNLRTRVNNAGPNDDVEIEQLTAVLARNPLTGRPEIVFRPDDLFSLIALQVSLLASGGAKLVNCKDCGRPFFHGGMSNRREGALYCDDICRERHKTKQRGLARRAAREKPKKKRGR